MTYFEPSRFRIWKICGRKKISDIGLVYNTNHQHMGFKITGKACVLYTNNHSHTFVNAILISKDLKKNKKENWKNTYSLDRNQWNFI